MMFDFCFSLPTDRYTGTSSAEYALVFSHPFQFFYWSFIYDRQVWQGKILRGDTRPEDWRLAAVRIRGVRGPAGMRAGILQDGQRAHR